MQGDVVLAATAAAPTGGGQLGPGRSGPAEDGGLAQEDAGSADEDSGEEEGGAGEDGLQRSLSREHVDAPGMPGGCCCRCTCTVYDSSMGLRPGSRLMCAICSCLLHVPATVPGGDGLASGICLVGAYMRLDFCTTVGHLVYARQARASTASCAHSRAQECSLRTMLLPHVCTLHASVMLFLSHRGLILACRCQQACAAPGKSIDGVSPRCSGACAGAGNTGTAGSLPGDASGVLPALSLTGGRALAATPRLRTRLFAASCILDLPAAMGGDPRHFDAVKAQVMDVPNLGDLSLLTAALACTYTFVCTIVHTPSMYDVDGFARSCLPACLPAMRKAVWLQLPLWPPWVMRDGLSNTPEQGQRH